MKKNKQNKQKNVVEKKHKYDKGQIFVKVMAGVLVLLMVSATAGTLVFALIG